MNLELLINIQETIITLLIPCLIMMASISKREIPERLTIWVEIIVLSAAVTTFILTLVRIWS